MRIALTHNLPSGGAKRHTFEQVRALSCRGNEIVEFAPSTADFDYCSFAPYVSRRVVYPFSPMSPARRVPLVSPYVHAIQGLATLRTLDDVNQRLAGEIDAQGFDVVLVKDCQYSMNPSILDHLKTPAVFQCHHGLRHRLARPAVCGPEDRGLLAQAKAIYYRPATELFERSFFQRERRSARHASRVLTNSAFSRELLAQHYGVDAGVIYPGINTAVFRPVSTERLDYVLSVGALIFGKGYRFLVAALARLDSRQRPMLFIAANSVDPAEERIVQEMAEAADVRLHVERIVDDDRLVQVYNQARAFVYAPIQEALGMAPLEAMACGTPVVGVAEGGVQETVRDGETGWLVERDEAAFAWKLAELLGDASTFRRMSETGVEVVRRDWTWSRAVDRLEQELRIVRGK